MKRQLVSTLVVVSMMQFVSICAGRSFEDDFMDTLLLKREDVDEDVEDNGYYYNEAEQESIFEKRQSGASALSASVKNKIINMHNDLRRGEGASDMQVLKYNNKLAELAQDWSARCRWGHRAQDSYSASDYGFSAVGENLYSWTGDGKSVPEQAIQAWFDEKNFYVYDSDYCTKEPCGHYTAVVWAGTREVGCGMTKCPSLHNTNMKNAYFFVCNYGPAGNMMGEKPFKKGSACSECGSGQFYCTNGLCDHSCKAASTGGRCECKARCENGKPTRNCKCVCNPGYSGVSCNELCEDKNLQCGANPGWPAKMCTDKNLLGGMMYDTVNQQCPKMCGKCK